MPDNENENDISQKVTINEVVEDVKSNFNRDVGPDDVQETLNQINEGNKGGTVQIW